MGMVDAIQIERGSVEMTNLSTFDTRRFFNDDGFQKAGFSAFGLV